jgi:IS30 family transposase
MNINKNKKYTQLNIFEREEIAILLRLNTNQKDIAEKINRNQSTISREINRNKSPIYNTKYSAVQSQKRSDERKKLSHQRCRLKNPIIQKYVEDKFKEYYSPEIIAGRLKIDHPELKINHESIYLWIYSERKDLIKYLFRGNKKRHKRKSGNKKRNIKINDRTMIDKREEEANNRVRIGDFEVDTAVSRQSKEALCVMADRSARFIILKKITSKHKDVMKEAILASLSEINNDYIKTLTFDNGTENACHLEIAKELKIKTYFCNPYHSWEKGTVENRIGRIRFFLPKKTDFSKVTDEELLRIQNILNNRPLKCLGFKTPYECMKYALRN